MPLWLRKNKRSIEQKTYPYIQHLQKLPSIVVKLLKKMVDSTTIDLSTPAFSTVEELSATTATTHPMPALNNTNQR
tara:strand:- start:120 stop:347 length:228 start_codon:yes stop_codon:yes gene_type:complete